MDYDKTHKTSAKKHYINKVYDEPEVSTKMIQK